MTGDNVNVQDWSDSQGTFHSGDNNRAHWARTNGVVMKKGATVFIGCSVENYALESDSFVGANTLLECNPYDRNTIDKNVETWGFAPYDRIAEIKLGTVMKEDGYPIVYYGEKGSTLEHRLDHIRELNHHKDEGHSQRWTNYIAIPKVVVFDLLN